MRNLFKTIDHVEHVLIRDLDRRPAPSKQTRSRQPSYWRAPATDTQYPKQVFKSKERKPMTLAAKALKVTAVLDPAAVALLPTPDGQQRCKLIIDVEGKSYTADINMKSLRKVRTAITAGGADNVSVILQGKLKGSEIVECGLVAQPKAAKADDSTRPSS